MRKEVLGGLLGIVMVFAGIASLYFYLEGLKITNNFLFLILAIVLLGPGIFILYRAGQINAYKPNLVPLESDGKNQGKLIKENSKLAKEWKKTTEQADKLRLLGIKMDQEK